MFFWLSEFKTICLDGWVPMQKLVEPLPLGRDARYQWDWDRQACKGHLFCRKRGGKSIFCDNPTTPTPHAYLHLMTPVHSYKPKQEGKKELFLNNGEWVAWTLKDLCGCQENRFHCGRQLGNQGRPYGISEWKSRHFVYQQALGKQYFWETTKLTKRVNKEDLNNIYELNIKKLKTLTNH